ncbi:MAG TPA: amidophosphoribosyltransferase [Clostridia bacterium]|nr:amidophosphoribosyltransferase [Clostridia bacterium]
MFDSIHEECGVFGIRAPKRSDVAASAYYALYALQHRGQESCGIAVNTNGVIKCHRDLGLVPEVFTERVLAELGTGTMAVGHTRYSTTGTASRINAQPLVVRHVKGSMAIAHNGNISNAFQIKQELEMTGAIFHSTNDSEVISYVITSARLIEPSIEKAIEKAMYRLEGAYSMVVMSPRKLIAVRDPHGFRPLCIGQTEDGSIIFTSETCALNTLNATWLRDVEPGEIVIADENGLRSIKTHCGQNSGLCVFELVYFARPDSVIDGASVHAARLKAGELLWKEHPVEADVVIGVPDSGLDAALGFSKASGIPYGVGFIKNRYIGRTFIQPSQGQRQDSVRIKLNVLRETVAGKRVVMIDDSIVRGTTCANIVNLLRHFGAKEVHMRVSCPPFRHPCFFGTDIDSTENLIACQMSVPEIAEKIGVDSLGYLSVEGVKSIAKPKFGDFCVGCFTGQYPISVPECEVYDKFQFELPTGETD